MYNFSSESDRRDMRMEKLESEEKAWQVEANRLTHQFQLLHAMDPIFLREISGQFVNMASGGSGFKLPPERNLSLDTLNVLSFRDQNYKGYPDWVFDIVCCDMGWHTND